MKVKGGHDFAARKAVEDYDDWYATYNLDDLMRERMEQKERKKVAGGGPTRRGYAVTSASSRSTPLPPNNIRRAGRRVRDSMVNPQLDPRIKTEPPSRSVTPASVYSLDPATLNRAYVPPMRSWAALPYDMSNVKVESLSSSPPDDDIDFDFEPNPEPTRQLRNHHQRVPTYTSLSMEDEWDMDETITDASKLKGVHWPGMAMFDSATPDMKRKRNQKKAFSVVEGLQATSELVEATELVFDASGELRRQRAITGNPELDEDDSLLSGEVTPEPEAPSKKKSARRPRPALLDKHVNTGRVLRRPSSHHPGYERRSSRDNRRGPYYDGPDEDEDDDLTYAQARRPKKRTGLSIHRDNSGPDITFDHPAPFNYLTSGLTRGGFQPNASTSQTAPATFSHTQFGRTHQRQPSFGFGPFRPANASIGMPPAANFGSFGQLNAQTLFQHNGLSVANGQTALQAFQQQFGLGVPQQNFSNDNNPMFQSYNQFQPQAA